LFDGGDEVWQQVCALDEQGVDRRDGVLDLGTLSGEAIEQGD
jgi:hypothetical protein